MKRLISFIQNRRFALSVLCVSLLITGSLFLSSKILMRKDSIIKYGPYYNSETEYDVLFFGTSHVYDGISPIYLYHKYGISSYNMGMNSASVADSYYGLRRVIKEGKKPHAVVIDVYETLGDDAGKALVAPTHYMNDMFPLDLEKLRAASNLFSDKTEREMILFPFSEYHNRWKEVSRNDIFPSENKNLGLQILYDVSPPDKVIIRDRELSREASPNQREYLRRIKELCDTEDIKLLYINIPYSYQPDFQKRENGVYELSEDLGVPYINYMNEASAPDFDIHFRDTGHLNIAGAHVMTDILGKELLKMGIPESSVKNEQYWNTLYEDYNDTLLNYFKSCKDLKAYLSTLYAIDPDKINVELLIGGETDILSDPIIKKLIDQLDTKGFSRFDVRNCSLIMSKGREADISVIIKDADTAKIIDRADFDYDLSSGIIRN